MTDGGRAAGGPFGGARRRVLAAAVAVALGLGAWAVLAGRSGDATSRHLAGTVDYLPGRAADVYLPVRATAAPVVVLVPGGGWVTADRSGMRPLADALAGAGMVAVTATYRAAQDGARFPQPVRDVGCAVDFAVARARQAGVRPGPVVVLGHSAGAQLAALTALAGTHLSGRCPYPHAGVDGLVGLSGPYDVTALPDVARPLFGVDRSTDPALWREGDPYAWVGRPDSPTVPVLLVHGAADTLVPARSSEDFAAALRRAGHEVRLAVLPGVDHLGTFSAERAGPLVTRWVRHLPQAAASSPPASSPPASSPASPQPSPSAPR